MKIKKQEDVKDCGVVVIQTFIKELHHKTIEINELKLKAKYGTVGINIDNMIGLGSSYGLVIEGYKTDFETLIANINETKFITTIDVNGENHYIICEIKNERVFVWDPMSGFKKITIEEFKDMYQGIVISVESKEYPQAKMMLKKPFKFFVNNPSIITWIMVSITLSIVLSLTSSLFMKVILDKVVPGVLTNTLTILVFAFVWIAILTAMNGFLKHYMILKLKNNIEVSLNKEFFKQLRFAKLSDLNKITNSDYIRRLSLIPMVANFIANTAFIIFSDVLSFGIVTSLMIAIDPHLFAFAVGAAVLITITSLFMQKFLASQYGPLMKANLNDVTSSIDMISSFHDSKHGTQGAMLSKQQRANYTKTKTLNWRIWKLNSIDGFINGIIHLILPIVVVFVFVNQIFDGKNTVGTMLMFLSFLSIFLNPIEDFATLYVKFKQSMRYVEMLEFVLQFDQEKLNPNGFQVEQIDRLRLTGINFGYDKKIFKIKDHLFDKNLHLTGKNGSGKSTLVNLLAGQYEFEGNLLVNDMESDFISLKHYREKTFIARPMTYMPNTSVLEYITLGNYEAVQRFNQNIAKYGLFNLFKDMDINLNKTIVNNGSNLSSGQKQLVHILRLFAFDFNLVVIDEGVENIDKKKIKFLSRAILLEQENALFLEISHSKNYISISEEVDIEQIIKSPY